MNEKDDFIGTRGATKCNIFCACGGNNYLTVYMHVN